MTKKMTIARLKRITSLTYLIMYKYSGPGRLHILPRTKCLLGAGSHGTLSICHPSSSIIAVCESIPSHALLATLASPSAAGAFNSFMIASLRDSGFVVDAQRPLTLPSLPIKNFSKFHLILVRPRMPGCSFFNHSQRGSTLLPLTSVLPSLRRRSCQHRLPRCYARVVISSSHLFMLPCPATSLDRSQIHISTHILNVTP
jgi:hypothetical protein